MDNSILTAMAGLAGAAIGGLTSFLTSWLTLRTQMSQSVRAAARNRREEGYTDFIKEASRLFGDAFEHGREDVSAMITIHALVARMRLIASSEVTRRADLVLDAIVEAYLGPNHTLRELREFAHGEKLNPLRSFSEACRVELDGLEKL